MSRGLVGNGHQRGIGVRQLTQDDGIGDLRLTTSDTILVVLERLEKAVRIGQRIERAITGEQDDGSFVTASCSGFDRPTKLVDTLLLAFRFFQNEIGEESVVR